MVIGRAGNDGDNKAQDQGAQDAGGNPEDIIGYLTRLVA